MDFDAMSLIFKGCHFVSMSERWPTVISVLNTDNCTEIPQYSWLL